MTAFEISGAEISTPADDGMGNVMDVEIGVGATVADVVPGDAVKTLRGDTVLQADGEMLGIAVFTDEAIACCASRLL